MALVRLGRLPAGSPLDEIPPTSGGPARSQVRRFRGFYESVCRLQSGPPVVRQDMSCAKPASWERGGRPALGGRRSPPWAGPRMDAQGLTVEGRHHPRLVGRRSPRQERGKVLRGSRLPHIAWPPVALRQNDMGTCPEESWCQRVSSLHCQAYGRFSYAGGRGGSGGRSGSARARFRRDNGKLLHPRCCGGPEKSSWQNTASAALMVRNGATFFINILKILQKYVRACILIECGASLSARTAGGLTPADCGVRAGACRAVCFLLQPANGGPGPGVPPAPLSPRMRGLLKSRASGQPSP